MPTAMDYAEAFRSLADRITEKQLEMLKAHYAAPDRSISMAALATAVGYPNYSSANLQYGTLARMVANATGYVKDRIEGQSRFIDALARPNPHQDADEEWQWVMREEVARALEQLGWATPVKR